MTDGFLEFRIVAHVGEVGIGFGKFADVEAKIFGFFDIFDHFLGVVFAGVAASEVIVDDTGLVAEIFCLEPIFTGLIVFAEVVAGKAEHKPEIGVFGIVGEQFEVLLFDGGPLLIGNRDTGFGFRHDNIVLFDLLLGGDGDAYTGGEHGEEGDKPTNFEEHLD